VSDLHSKSEMRAMHVRIKRELSEAARAIAAGHWAIAEECYLNVEGWASSLRLSAIHNDGRED
jgi:hypothetical protein